MSTDMLPASGATDPPTAAVDALIAQAVEQGYPRHVEDPAAIERVAAIMRGADEAKTP